MPPIQNEDDLDEWTQGIGDDAARTIAIRAALSAVPHLMPYIEKNPRSRASAIALPCFRSNAINWLSCTWPLKQDEDLTTARGAASAPLKRAASDAALHAAGDTTDTVGNDDGSIWVRAGDARNVAMAAVWADSGMVKEAVWVAKDAAGRSEDATLTRVICDANAIKDGCSLTDLSSRALWAQGLPSAISKQWNDLKAYLLSLDENWEVWTEWYEDRLAGSRSGRTLIMELERSRCLVPSEVDWKKGPHRVNTILALCRRPSREPRAHLTATGR